jgi:hypothetical protein
VALQEREMDLNHRKFIRGDEGKVKLEKLQHVVIQNCGMQLEFISGRILIEK